MVLISYKKIFITKPKLLPDNFDSEEFREKYKVAVCKCEVDTRYALIIPREYTNFECAGCGLCGEIY